MSTQKDIAIEEIKKLFNEQPNLNTYLNATVTQKVVSDYQNYCIEPGTNTFITLFEDEFFALIQGTNLYTTITPDCFNLT